MKTELKLLIIILCDLNTVQYMIQKELKFLAVHIRNQIIFIFPNRKD